MTIRIQILALALSLLPAVMTAQTRNEEQEAYNEARRTGTVEAWDIFLNNYPDSYYVPQARLNRDDAQVRSYCTATTPLDRLVAYIDNDEAQQPRIKLFYANLVNNPTHSYRYEHHRVGFNGCTGRVSETVTLPNGKKRYNVFTFDPRGLLVESRITEDDGKAVTTTYGYAYDNLHGHVLNAATTSGKRLDYAPFYDNANDKLTSLKCSNGQRINFTYNEFGSLQCMSIVEVNGRRRALFFRDGYVVREEVGDTVWRYQYDFNETTGKKYLISVKEIVGKNVIHERKYDYKIDDRGRFTRVDIILDGKPEMTIQRSY